MKKFGRFGLLFAAFALALTGCGEKKESKTPEERVDGAIEYVSTQYDAKGLTVGVTGDFNLITSYDKVTISYVSDKPEVVKIENNKAVVTRSTEADELVSLSATFTYDKVSKPKTFGVKVLKASSDLTIAEIQAKVDAGQGNGLTTSGIVVAVSEAKVHKSATEDYASLQFNAYIQNETAGGLYIYGIPQDTDSQAAFKVGNKVQVTGNVTDYNGLYEMNSYSNFEYELLAENQNVPEYANLTADFADKCGNKLLQSTLVELNNVVVLEKPVISTEDLNFDVATYRFKATLDGVTFTISMDNTVAATRALKDVAGTLNVNDEITIKSVVSWFNGFQPIPLEMTKTGTHQFSDQEKVDMAANAFSFTRTQAQADFDLPTTADDGVTISWASDNTKAISIDPEGNKAHVTRGADDVDVHLTATFKLGDTATAEKTYTVKVIKQDTSTAESVTYDFSNLTEKGTALTTATALTKFNDSYQGTIANKLEEVTLTENVYSGNGTGGAYANSAGFLKFGTGKANGKITLKFLEGTQINKVVIACHDWYKKSDEYPTNTNNVSVNSGATQLAPYNTNGDFEELTFEITATNEITIESNLRIFVQSITFYFAA